MSVEEGEGRETVAVDGVAGCAPGCVSFFAVHKADFGFECVLVGLLSFGVVRIAVLWWWIGYEKREGYR